jgi:hypothetical protein
MAVENVGLSHIVGVSVSRGFHYYWIFIIKPVLIFLLTLLIIYIVYKILKE